MWARSIVALNDGWQAVWSALSPGSHVYGNPFAALAQIRLQREQTILAIDRVVASAPVVLFIKGTPDSPRCGFSRAILQVLSFQGIDLSKLCFFDVLEDSRLQAGLKQYSSCSTIPQLYVEKRFVGGYDAVASMHETGHLMRLLREKRVLLCNRARTQD